MTQTNNGGRLWSIVLAGSESTRAESFVHRWVGQPRSKQFCNFVGARSLLQHTLDRANRLTLAKQSVLVIGQAHRQEAMTQLDGREVGNVLFQPADRNTAAEVFLPLTYVWTRDPLATVILYPSDHFVYPEEPFLDAIREAVPATRRLPDRIVLLGAPPDRLERDDGWILPGARLADSRTKAVRQFLEKPTAQQADHALSGNVLRNTMVMVAKAETLWRLGQRCFPELMRRFERLGRAIGTSEEARVLKAIYETMPRRNLYSDLLRQVPERVAVTELTNVFWSDWGRPECIPETLRRIGCTPAFARSPLNSPCADTAPQSSRREGLNGSDRNTSGWCRSDSVC